MTLNEARARFGLKDGETITLEGLETVADYIKKQHKNSAERQRAKLDLEAIEILQKEAEA